MTREEMKSLSRGESVDNASETMILRRIQIASEPWKLSNTLSAAQYLGKAEAAGGDVAAQTEESGTAQAVR